LDNDGDGYCCYRQLALNIDVKPIPRNVNLDLLYCLSSCTSIQEIYFSTEKFKADSLSEDIILIDIGGTNPELVHGNYWFGLGIIDTVHGIIPVYNLEEIQSEVRMEASSEDVLTCTFSNVEFSENAIDSDGDGYYSDRDLNFSVGVNSGSHQLYTKIFLKRIDEKSFEYYFKSDPFLVDAENPEDVNIEIGSSNTPIIHGKYEIKLELYKKSGNKLIGCLNAEDNPVLTDLHFETGEEDSPTFIKENDLFNIPIYPNPFSGKFFIDLSSSEVNSSLAIEIFNAKGELIKVFLKEEFENQIKEYDLEEQTPGVYIVRLKTNKSIRFIKLIKR
jgi:hypothetical protein